MFKPFNERVLIKPEEKKNETASGILLAVKNEEKPVIGTVEVGCGEIEKGDKVLFSKFGYDEVELKGETYYLVSISNILGKFND